MKLLPETCNDRGYFGFDRTVYGVLRKNRKRKWYDELQEERIKDIQAEMMMEEQ